MGTNKQNCTVLRHEATIDILQPGTGVFTYFTDLTENHYKALISVRIEDITGGSPNAQLIVTPRTGPDTTINFTESAAIQIEDARAVKLSTSSPGIIGGSMNIVKDFCMCCSDLGEVQRHEETFSFRGSDFLFTDLTENHYTAMVVVRGRLEGEVVVTPRTGDPVTITLPPNARGVIQIEDAQSLSIQTRPAREEPRNTVEIIKDFCISCP